MKFLVLLALSFAFVGCAHHYKQDRQMSSVEEEQVPQHRLGLGDTFSSRY